MIAKILLTLFLVGTIILFVMSASRPPEEVEIEPEDFTCVFTNPDDCSSYLNCLDAVVQCPIMERFDTNTMSCRTYFDVDCGTRPNPPDPTTLEICAPHFNGLIPGIGRYPLRNCRYFANCNIDDQNQRLGRCSSNVQNFDIEISYCRDNVDCGNRCLDLSASCPTPT